MHYLYITTIVTFYTLVSSKYLYIDSLKKQSFSETCSSTQ